MDGTAVGPSSAPIRCLQRGQRRKDQSSVWQKGPVEGLTILMSTGFQLSLQHQLFPGHVCSGTSRLGTRPKPEQACVLLPLLHCNAGTNAFNAWPLVNCFFTRRARSAVLTRKIAAQMPEHQCSACLNICSNQLDFPVHFCMRGVGGGRSKLVLVKSHDESI